MAGYRGRGRKIRGTRYGREKKKVSSISDREFWRKEASL